MQTHTVLIIEDSLYLAESLIDMLEMHQYNTLHAQTGTEGVRQALEQKPDLILLDIRLPDITGYEVLRRIQETDWGTNEAKVMILTASESIDNIAQNINLPLTDVLFKPEWSMQDLLQKIQDKITSPTK